jgi:uncharacterized repeat protein (TIGR03803 family)
MKNTFLTRSSVRLAITALAVAITATVVSAQETAAYEIVSSFTIAFDAGKAPSSIVQANDGSFYGTTSGGGTFDAGVLFRMDGTGVVTPLHNFTGSTDGGAPFLLVRASDGRLYGATQRGALGFGTVFRFTPGGDFTTLYAFSSVEKAPVDLFAASDGNVYGLLAFGGDFANGAIFVIDSGGGVTTVHSVPQTAGRGMNSLVKGSDGRFYVTAEVGGANNSGTLFAIDDAGTITILHSFERAGDGCCPAGLIQGRDGRLYGMTQTFTPPTSILATVYAMDLAGNYQLLASFPSNVQPARRLDLLEASDGNFYGVTFAADDPMGPNSVFRLDSSGTLTTAQFGLLTLGQLIQGADGRLYDTTAGGGVDEGGTIIAMELAGTRTTLYEFTIGAGVGGAGRPYGVIQTRDGQFYGTTSVPLPISPRRGRKGTVFAMDAAGTRTTLHTFFANYSSAFFDDGSPLGTLFEGNDGSVYGTTWTYLDGGLPRGQIFKISPEGLFTRLASEYALVAGIIQARDGRLYGVADGNQVDANLILYGYVFRVEANGALTSLHRFGSDTDHPVGELVEIDDGSLYGVTAGGRFDPPPMGGPTIPTPGTIFRVDPATGAFAIRYEFPQGTTPAGRLIQGTDGLIYGTTVNGGAVGLGTVFSLDAAGTVTTLHEFTGADGANPNAGVTQGLDGRLYGTTRNGGANGYGTVFVMNVSGGLTTLHDFALRDGANPVKELIQANDSSFYGTAPSGGPQGGGVVFRISLTTTPSDQYFEIVSRNSGKCLDVSGASTEPAAPAIQWTCHGGLNQQWRLEPAGGGAFRIIARHSEQALDVYGALLDDVTPIIQWPVHGGDNQAWTLEPASDGYVRIVARHSGKAMDVEFASTDEGARVIQYTPHGNANQQWLFRPAQ